jgi:hypothetical protein
LGVLICHPPCKEKGKEEDERRRRLPQRLSPCPPTPSALCIVLVSGYTTSAITVAKEKYQSVAGRGGGGVGSRLRFVDIPYK